MPGDRGACLGEQGIAAARQEFLIIGQEGDGIGRAQEQVGGEPT